MASQITATLPALDFPLEADYPTQEDWAAFSAAAELNFGILGNDWSTQMQLWKTEANAMSIELNNNADIAQSIANYQGDWVSQGYTLGQTVSIGGIYYICKLTHATGQNPTADGSIYWNLALGNWSLKVNTDMSGYISKPTPVDADLIPLSDSAASFGLKKLSWANLKATLLQPIIATGTATFTATTNNINLTGIGIGIEIGDVIQISGAIDAKNNSEFTVEVITDANNIIVNQAHANKGTTKNVATQASDTGVTVKLLAKWYNASRELGRDWVNMTTSRILGTTYPNNTNRAFDINVVVNTIAGTGGGTTITIGTTETTTDSALNASYSHAFNSPSVVTKDSSYKVDSINGTLIKFMELR